ncbi:MAG: tetratricopeptide repeat protein [Candidatus Alcyoniella australis]|nr:tetratricopeptide repeat protein [Candidatus Alcyoniella australis]
MSQVRQEIKRAKEAFERGDHDSAEKLCVEIVKDHSQFADLYCLLGTIYHERTRFFEASQMFERALEINPNYLEARMNLVVAYNDLGEFEKAQEQISTIKSLAQEDGDAIDSLTKNRLANMHAQTGDLYCQANLYWEGSREYEKALTLRPRFVDIKVKLAVAFRKLGRIGEAMRQLEESLRFNPGYSSARVQLALTCHRAGADKRAIDLLEQVLQLNPDHEPAKLYLDTLSSGQGIS